MAPWSHTRVPHARFYQLTVRKCARRPGDGPRQVVWERGRQHSADSNITSDAEEKNVLENKRRGSELAPNASDARRAEEARQAARPAPPASRSGGGADQPRAGLPR